MSHRIGPTLLTMTLRIIGAALGAVLPIILDIHHPNTSATITTHVFDVAHSHCSMMTMVSHLEHWTTLVVVIRVVMQALLHTATFKKDIM
jgi:hypothetical protein